DCGVRRRVSFTGRAREALLAGPTATAGPASHSLALAADRRSGTIQVPALADGAYKLMLRGENGFDTELTGGDVSVWIDEPPAVSRFTNPAGGLQASDAPKHVLPYESVPISIALIDDLGVASAEIEYRVNDGSVQREEIALLGRGNVLATARHVFQLGGKVKEGDEVHYRLRITDNRDVPEAGLKPHVVYYPAERWLGLRVVGQTVPLAQQEIQAQREDIDKRLA